MTFVKQLAGTTAFGVAMLTGFGLSAPPAQAGYIVTLEQMGSNVVATGSGALDLTGLTPVASGVLTSAGHIIPSAGIFITGPSNETDSYTGFSGPTSFGSGSFVTVANSDNGDTAGISLSPEEVIVPQFYASGSALSDTSTYDNATFASLGVTPGTYVWTWGSDATDDTFTLQIGPAAAVVPEPSSLALLGGGLGLLGLIWAGAVRRRSSG